MLPTRTYFSMCYYTKCVLLQIGCALKNENVQNYRYRYVVKQVAAECLWIACNAILIFKGDGGERMEEREVWRPDNQATLSTSHALVGWYSNSVLQWLIESNYCEMWPQTKQLKQYIISFRTIADALKINVLNTKTFSTSGDKAMTPTGGFAPSLGALPQTPSVYALPCSPWVRIIIIPLGPPSDRHNEV